MTRGSTKLQANRGSVRHHVVIDRPADEVWALVGDPTRVPEWFPGIVSCEVSGDERTVVTAGGLPIPERILTLDPLQRRFQYQIEAPICRFHLGTLDVVELGDRRCLVVYATDAEPSTVALTIGGGAAAALRHLGGLFEGDR